MTTKKVFFGKGKTVVNQFELAAVQKTANGGLDIYLKNGTKLIAKGEDAAHVWGDLKKATLGDSYDPDFYDGEE